MSLMSSCGAHPPESALFVILITGSSRASWHKTNKERGVHMRKIFILFALVFALVTTATATVVTTALTSDTAMALATR
jgi:hypothetical protein